MQLFHPLMSALFAAAFFGASFSNVWADDDGKKSGSRHARSRSTNSEKSESSDDEGIKAVSDLSTEPTLDSDLILRVKKMFNRVAPSALDPNVSIGGSSHSVLPAYLGSLSNPAAFQQFPKPSSLDPDQAKSAINQGMAASLPLLLTYLKQNYPGELLDVQLHNAGPGYVYEVRYLSNVVFLRTVYLDAITLQQK
ncbi:MAG: hypothetical protein ABJA10_06945 [Aestuariivirga sp.]